MCCGVVWQVWSVVEFGACKNAMYQHVRVSCDIMFNFLCIALCSVVMLAPVWAESRQHDLDSEISKTKEILQTVRTDNLKAVEEIRSAAAKGSLMPFTKMKSTCS